MKDIGSKILAFGICLCFHFIPRVTCRVIHSDLAMKTWELMSKNC